MPLILPRLDNNLWRLPLADVPSNSAEKPLQEIRISTPTWSDPGIAYRLTKTVAKYLKGQNIHFKSQLEQGFSLEFTDQAAPLYGKWDISLVVQKGLWNQFRQSVPLLKRYPNQLVAQVTVSRVNSTICNFIESVAGRTKPTLISSESFKEKKACLPFAIKPFSERLQEATFADPFTQLATKYLQTVDPYFVSEEQVNGAFRYVLGQDGMLRLKKLSTTAPSEAEIAENRSVARLYRDFILSEFGLAKLQFVNAAYGFSLDEIVEKGLPLMPDHIFKMNIGMNNVEMADVEKIIEKLRDFTNNPDIAALSMHEHRALRRAMSNPTATTSEIVAFLQPLLPQAGSDIKELPPKVFNTFVNIVMPTQEERQRAYTGRQILHLAVSGEYRLGNPSIANPSRDQFDLMQIFDQLQTTADWENCFELMAHVLPMKTAYRITPPSQLIPGHRPWHVGILLPGPNTREGDATWYYNQAFYDDGQGNLNLVFLPCCNNYRENDACLPLIKAYRGTTDQTQEIDNLEGIVADLNPYVASAESLDPKSSFAFEKGYIDKRTIPLWVAKMVHQDSLSDAAEKKRFLKEALAEYLTCIKTPASKLQRATELTQSDDKAAIRHFLYAEAELHKELPQYKIAQDLAFIGHSLGASLAQFGLYYFGPRRHRIPMQGCRYICFSSHGPSVTNDQDKCFMEFGQKNREFLAAWGPAWYIRQQLEYGDFVPTVGASHLGTTGYDPEKDPVWLKHNINVFRPLETAESLGITTMPIHCRRTGMALQERDYSLIQLTTKELEIFDHAWVLPKKLEEDFGLGIFSSSKLNEACRRIAAIIASLFIRAYVAIYNSFHNPIPRNKEGVIYLHYRPIVS